MKKLKITFQKTNLLIMAPKSFRKDDLTSDHMYGWQNEYLDKVSDEEKRFVTVSGSVSVKPCPSYEFIEKLAYDNTHNHISIITTTAELDKSDYFRLSCIFNNGKLHSPSDRIPAVVFICNEVKHSLWYKNGTPYRNGLPNYIIEYEVFNHTHKMFYFNENYKLNDVEVTCKHGATVIMPARMVFARLRSGAYFEFSNYNNGVELSNIGHSCTDVTV